MICAFAISEFATGRSTTVSGLLALGGALSVGGGVNGSSQSGLGLPALGSGLSSSDLHR